MDGQNGFNSNFLNDKIDLSVTKTLGKTLYRGCKSRHAIYWKRIIILSLIIKSKKLSAYA